LPRARPLRGDELEKQRVLVGRLMNNPRDIDALNDLARLFLEMDSVPQALLVLARASEVDSTKAPTKNLMGVAFEKLGKSQDAYLSYSFALERDPKLSSARANLAAFCLKHRDQACARNAVSGLKRQDLGVVPLADLSPDARKSVAR
jgi:Flp pilus assembly protein TadD